MNLTEAAATFIWPKFYVFGSILAESDIGLFDNENNELIVSLSLSLSLSLVQLDSYKRYNGGRGKEAISSATYPTEICLVNVSIERLDAQGKSKQKLNAFT